MEMLAVRPIAPSRAPADDLDVAKPCHGCEWHRL